MEILVIGLLVVNILAYVAMKVTKKKPAAVTAEGVAVGAPVPVARSKEERFTLIARLLKGRKEGGRIERNITTAGLLIKPSEFMVANLFALLFVVGCGLFYLAFVWPNNGFFFTFVKRFFFLIFTVWLGWKGPQMVLQFMANSRRSKLEYQLADALTIISSSLKGGYSFVQGLDMAGNQMETPIKEEIQRCMRLIQLGLDTPRALQQMSDRINSYDYDMTISATNIQLAVGGNLSQLLEGISNTIRDRIRLRREISALTAQGRISGAILIGLPIGIAVMLRVINPEYMGYLTDTEIGNNILYGAAGLQFVGIWWIKNLLDFDK